jgi:ribosomal protein S18 acetylase RimI-like enzyme
LRTCPPFVVFVDNDRPKIATCLCRFRADTVTRVIPNVSVSPVDAGELDEVRALLREYAGALPFALDFQGFADELATLPGAYAAPGGALLAARDGHRLAGCVALRPIDGETCEMKRLYVRPQHRGSGLGRLLVEAIVDAARTHGYRRMRLDTTPGMDAAQGLYEELGFREIPAYTHNPVAGTRFLQLEL